ncbi:MULTISPECIES: hypothetical protein [Halomonadaceae]|uniref:Uncharacterized protein n=2 Tax=Vreelandella TaxID=3137766 RepID=A0A7Z0RWU6_9GAMM|nr:MULTISPECIES: hypothetical protein [Halomonas]NYS76472.1 hypothetical protein [Halomonas glaciei]
MIALNEFDQHNADYIVNIGINSRLPKESDIPIMLVRKTRWQMGAKVEDMLSFQQTPGNNQAG